MTVVADESVEGPTVFALRAVGPYGALHRRDLTGNRGFEVLAIARREQALLLTADKDFGELVFRNREPHFGVLLIRSSEVDPAENAANTLAAIQQRGPELLNRFSVLVGRALRVRIAPY